jgi:hypothetical protein
MTQDPAPTRRLDLYTKSVLTIIAVLLATLSLRPLSQPPPVHAQQSDNQHLYFEPGTTILRNPDGSGEQQGKVVIDRRTGDIWGFPTRTSAPYPVVPYNKNPPISRPIYLGKFDFAAMQRQP